MFNFLSRQPTSPALPSPPPSCTPELAEMVFRVNEIKAKYVDANLSWYRTHRVIPFLCFRATGLLTIVLSAALPALATYKWADDTAKTVVVAIVSVAIAALAGLGAFFKWEKTWRGRAMSGYAIEGLCAKWELEIQNAYTLTSIAEQRKHVYLATSDLLTNFRAVAAAESEEFFSGLQFPQSDKAGQNAKQNALPAPPEPTTKPRGSQIDSPATPPASTNTEEPRKP